MIPKCMHNSQSGKELEVLRAILIGEDDVYKMHNDVGSKSECTMLGKERSFGIY